MSIKREAEVQQLWGEGAFRGELLRARSGESFRVVYEGRRGAGAGPDFRDAVLVDECGARRYGDVEIHLRAANWHAHGHDRDHRYDTVALHVVLSAGTECETALAGGASAPLTVLDLKNLDVSPGSTARERWPCDGIAGRLGTVTLRGLLHEMGMRRLDDRAARLAEELRREKTNRRGEQCAPWGPTDRILWAALAEGLGYGRDRAALRAAGIQLLSENGDLGRPCDTLPSIERHRLAGLLSLRDRWRETGPWASLREAIVRETPHEAGACLVRLLCVEGGAVSAGRARILAANVVLPLAVALARLAEDVARERWALDVYSALVAPPSNTLTRLLARQFSMGRLPPGAPSHMGLQHIWATWCRQKLCASCPVACTSALGNCERQYC